jgi:peptidoglycan hydrolase-like protein with peptidoglycan-binding domain
MSTTYSAAGPQQSRGFLVAAGAICAVVVVAVVAFAGFALGVHSESTSAAPAPIHIHTVVDPVTPKTTVDSVSTLQQQLAQLNLYSGSIDGIMGPKTIAGITAIQREAGLPQTGKMNSATQTALNYYLANDLPGSG